VSTSVYWRPVTPAAKGGYGVPTKSYLLRAWPDLEHRPVLLGRADISVLQGMRAATENDEAAEELEELLEAIDRHEVIALELR
jgi:hypothetical protein